MALYEVKGTFLTHTIVDKDGRNGSYAVGDAVFTIDQSYTGREGKVEKLTPIPFRALGKVAESVRVLTGGEVCAIKFDISGREWQGRHYSELKLVSITLDTPPF